jgi:prepilin-type N-terminal cleavage/methylation domain-containing protein
MRRAFTLIELIVVVAIIGILSAIAVPTLHKVGILGRNQVDAGAGQLISILKAARTYAGTNSVDTCVAFNTVTKIDSWSNEECQIFNGAAIMRRMTRNELEDLTRALVANGELAQDKVDEFKASFVGSESANRLPFLPVGGAENAWRKFPHEVVVGYLRDTATPAMSTNAYDWREKGGLCPVRALDSNLSLLKPSIPFWVDIDPSDASQYNKTYALKRWPAIIFQPTGTCYSPGSESARFKLTVCKSPEIKDSERMGQWANVEIFSTIGKVQAAEN